MTRLCLRRPVATAMFFLAVALLGVVSFTRLPVDLLPDVAFPSVSVSTVYRGAGPVEVERLVSRPVEERLGRVAGVREVTSRSREGHSLVRLEFYWGTDMEFAALHVREQLDHLAPELPREAARPVILSSDPTDEPILTVAVTGRPPLALAQLSETVLKRRLEQLDGVALAAVAGAPRREIQVVVDPAALGTHGLQLAEVAGALDRANYSAPGGMVRRGRFQYSLRTLGRFQEVDDLRSVTVGVGDGGGPVRLSDVAEVRNALAEPDAEARFNGDPAVGLHVYKAAGANTVRVSDRVGAMLAGLRAEYPELGLDVATSQASFVRAAIANVVQALVLGGALAFLVLFLFLGEPRYPLAVGVAIPLSVLAAFTLLYLFDVSLNVMSLGGLALGVGMLVDNSIVVLENVFRHRDEERAAPQEAAAVGTREVAAAITASTLTTVAVFGPVLYVEGVAGELFADLSLAVAFSLLASLLVALTLLPLLAARAAGGRGSSATPGAVRRFTRPVFEAFERRFRRLGRRYEGALAWSLDHPTSVAAAAAGALAAALVLGASLPRSLMPEVDEGRFRVALELPVGTPLEVTSGRAARLEEALLAQEGVDAVFTRAGRAPGAQPVTRRPGGLNAAALEVRLSEEGPSTDRVVRSFRAALPGLGVDPAFVTVETGRATSLGQALDLGEADLAVRVKGDDLTRLTAVAESARVRLEGLSSLYDVRVDLQRAQPALAVDVRRAAVARHGLTVHQVADAVEGYLRGAEADRPYMEFADRVTIRVQLPDPVRRDLSGVLRLPVQGVPLDELVEVRRTYAPVEIRREGQTRTVRVLADVRGGLGAAVESARARLSGLDVPAPTTVEVGGADRRMRRSFRSLLFAFALALFLVYLILAAQFESVVQPLVVLAAVPLAAVGAVAALWVTGGGLNTMSGIGLVILVGIVVNDAIIKVDFINQERARGRERRAALLEAGRLRFRPIVMTTVTTVLGLTPLALGWGTGADLRAPLAVAVIGGLLSATFLTLLVVPVLYALVDR